MSIRNASAIQINTNPLTPTSTCMHTALMNTPAILCCWTVLSRTMKERRSSWNTSIKSQFSAITAEYRLTHHIGEKKSKKTHHHQTTQTPHFHVWRTYRTPDSILRSILQSFWKVTIKEFNFHFFSLHIRRNCGSLSSVGGLTSSDLRLEALWAQSASLSFCTAARMSRVPVLLSRRSHLWLKSQKTGLEERNSVKSAWSTALFWDRDTRNLVPLGDGAVRPPWCAA